jgi:hypothetical protein
MTKQKVTVTLTEDFIEMVNNAKLIEKKSFSETLEMLARLAGFNYLPHRIEVDLLANDTASLRISTDGPKGNDFFRKRHTNRGELMATSGMVAIGVAGGLKLDTISTFLRSIARSTTSDLTNGQKIVKKENGIIITIYNTGMGKEAHPIQKLCLMAADEIDAAEIRSFKDVAECRCPKCGCYMIRKSVWIPKNGKVEVEWCCGLEHLS